MAFNDREPLSDIGQNLDRAGQVVHRSVDTLGRMGAFGLTGALINQNSPTTAEKMRLLQNVYDNFGHQATTNLLGAHAVSSVFKRLPTTLKRPLGRGATMLVRNKPLINRVISFAGQIARAI